MNRSRPSRREVSERLRADVPATPADDPFVATLAHVAASRFPTRGTSVSAVRTLRAARGFKVVAASAAVAVVMAGGAYAAARVDHDRPAGPAPATDGSTLHGEDLLPVDSDRPDQTGDDSLDVEEQTTFEHDDHAAPAEHGDDQGDDQGEQDSQDDQQAGLSDGPEADDSGAQQISPPKGDRDGAGTRDRDRGDDHSEDSDNPENDGADDPEDGEEPDDAETGSSDDDPSDGSEADDGGSDDSGSGDASHDGSSGETDATTS